MLTQPPPTNQIATKYAPQSAMAMESFAIALNFAIKENNMSYVVCDQWTKRTDDELREDRFRQKMRSSSTRRDTAAPQGEQHDREGQLIKSIIPEQCRMFNGNPIGE